MSRKGQGGFTLIELITVLIVGSVIMLFASIAVTNASRTAEVNQARHNVTMLTGAVNAFYEAYCQVLPVANRPSPTITRLVNEGFLANAESAENPWGGDFAAQIIWGRHAGPANQKGTTLRIRGRMDTRYTANRIMANLGATRVGAGNWAEWDSKPTIFFRPGGENVMRHLRTHFVEDSDACR